ncbi:hypothetical protein HKD37_14G039419 [Glycine soja]
MRLLLNFEGDHLQKQRRKKEKISWFRGYQCLQRKKKSKEESQHRIFHLALNAPARSYSNEVTKVLDFQTDVQKQYRNPKVYSDELHQVCQWVVSQEELQEIPQYGSTKHPRCSDRGGETCVGEEDPKWWRSRPASPRSARDERTSCVMVLEQSGMLWVLPPSTKRTTRWLERRPARRRVFGAKSLDKEFKLIWAGSRSGVRVGSGVGSTGSILEQLGSSSSATRRKALEAKWVPPASSISPWVAEVAAVSATKSAAEAVMIRDLVVWVSSMETEEGSGGRVAEAVSGVEAACSGIKFGQDGLKAILASGRKVMVGWRLLWMAMVWAVMESMEGSHGSSVRRVAAVGECSKFSNLANIESSILHTTLLHDPVTKLILFDY